MTMVDRSAEVMSLLRKAEINSLKAYGDNWLRIARETVLSKGIYDTGELYEKLGYAVDEGNVTVDVFSNAAHSIYNELGTYKMKARPFMQPSVQEANMGLFQTIKQEVEYTGLSSTQISPSIY